MQYLIFAACLWAFCLLGLALHISDVRRRYEVAVMSLPQYERTRPLDWLMAAAFIFAAAAAVLVALDGPALLSGESSAAGKLHLAIVAALVAVGLIYVGTRGAGRAGWLRDRFLSQPGASATDTGKAQINVRMEAEMDAEALGRVAWPAYIIVTLIALCVCFLIPEFRLMAPIALVPAAGGAGLVYMMLQSLPNSGAEEDW